VHAGTSAARKEGRREAFKWPVAGQSCVVWAWAVETREGKGRGEGGAEGYIKLQREEKRNGFCSAACMQPSGRSLERCKN
jgi:hypothetical protein